ncbi:haloacid dehalogenase type II [Zoogloea sp.]|uniref:haloacid dehalogenase type II n=1 Tax=Zoogloea sp. TaxID=49181 RepID=UPI0035AFA8D9|nr:haloacid dehalogenase type II [Rhodocyclales bacterium]
MAHTPRIQAVVFDAFGTLFDVYSVGLLAEQLYPGKGNQLAELWRAKQIEYSFIRSLSGQYKPFWQITQDGLDYAAARLGLPLDAARRTQLMNQYACLSPFPESLGALRSLKAAGLPLGILSNGTREMLDVAIKSAGMHGLFEHVLSADAVRSYKTSAAAYQMGPDAFGCPAERILFVSSNGWDAAGATWFGYTTFWINRNGLPQENLDVAPDGSGYTMDDLVRFAQKHLSR